jgi:hypothetical protein
LQKRHDTNNIKMNTPSYYRQLASIFQYANKIENHNITSWTKPEI